MKAFKSIRTGILNSTTRQTSFPCRASCVYNASTRPMNHERHQRRPYVSNPFTQNQTLTAHRILHYPAATIYEIIADVASYSQFLPYCQKSTVTKYSSPAKDGKRYPEEATLTIGFNENIGEEFTSRVYCVPERVVEAVSGSTLSTLSGEDISHHGPRPAAEEDPSRKNTVMANLLTRWTLRPYHYKPPPSAAATHPEGTHQNHHETNPLEARDRTEVNLAIEFSFSNPLYAALSSAAAPKVAEKMIAAFEDRVKAVIEGPAHSQGRRVRMEGVLKAKS